MMKKSIEQFHEQFSFEPHVEHASALGRFSRFAVVGMGGSNLTAPLLKIVHPALDLIVHRGYGLPALPEHELRDLPHGKALRGRLIICVSYSGNTEETLDTFRAAIASRLPVAVVTTGGALLAHAKEARVPYVVLPKTPGLQPRLSLGFQLMALLALMGKKEEMRSVAALAHTLRAQDTETQGKELAQKLHRKVPVIYASLNNSALAYIWKIKYNETAKIPAFANVFPELNHNEMTGFDVIPATRELSKSFAIVMLRDEEDHPRILARMRVTKALYEKRGIMVHEITMRGVSPWHTIMNTLLLADWTAYYLALFYGVEPNEVPMVEEFKKKIA